MKFKVNKIAAAVAVSLGTSVVGMNAAQADEVLFPYVVISDTVTTILTVINDDDARIDDLHYRYYYKNAANATDNTASCAEVDYRERTSPNDVVTFDAGGIFGDSKGVLFEPTQVNAVYNRDFALAFRNLPKPIRAFAIVDNNRRVGDLPTPGATVSGEAFIIEFATGSVWGYDAYNSSEIWSFIPPVPPATVGTLVLENPYDFSDRVEVNGEVLVPAPANADPDNYWVPLAFMPWGEVKTRLFVTPIGTQFPFQRAGNLEATIGLQVFDPNNPAPDVAYDRDENPVSGQVPRRVVCVGAVQVEDMITTAAQQFLVNSGGWSNVAVRAGQAVVMKLEFNDTTFTLDGTEVGGSYNNGFWLRKGFRESLPRLFTVGPAGRTWNVLPVVDIPGVDANASYPVIDQSLVPVGVPVLPVQGNTDPRYYSAWPANPQSVLDAINAGRISVSQ